MRMVEVASTMMDPQVAGFVSARRVARLATAGADGAPHAVPVCYAFDGRAIYSALDLKPKRVAPGRLKRVRNIAENPTVALVIDDYSEDWSKLGYVLIQGEATLLDAGQEREHAEGLLRAKYPQYGELLESGCSVLRIVPRRVVRWGRVQAD